MCLPSSDSELMMAVVPSSRHRRRRFLSCLINSLSSSQWREHTLTLSYACERFCSHCKWFSLLSTSLEVNVHRGSAVVVLAAMSFLHCPQRDNKVLQFFFISFRDHFLFCCHTEFRKQQQQENKQCQKRNTQTSRPTVFLRLKPVLTTRSLPDDEHLWTLQCGDDEPLVIWGPELQKLSRAKINHCWFLPPKQNSSEASAEFSHSGENLCDGPFNLLFADQLLLAAEI